MIQADVSKQIEPIMDGPVNLMGFNVELSEFNKEKKKAREKKNHHASLKFLSENIFLSYL